MSTPHPRDQAVETLLARQLSSLEPEPGSPCPEADVMAAWVERGLEPLEQSRVEQHVSSCARCQALAAVLVGSEPVAEAVAPWWRRFDVRWLVPLGAATAAILLWVVAPSPADRGAAEPVETMARVEAPAPLANEAARPQGGRVAGTEVPALQDEAAPGAKVPARLRERAAAATEASVPATRAPAPEEGNAVAPRGPGATTALDDLRARTAEAELEAAADRRKAAESLSAATPATAPPPAPPAAPAAALGSARSSAPSFSRWRVIEGRVERGAQTGADWTAVPTEQPVAAVAGVSAQVAWAVGRGGLVLRTLDGRTWSRTTAPTTDDLVAVTANEAGAATVRSVGGTLYRTADGGATWTPVP